MPSNDWPPGLGCPKCKPLSIWGHQRYICGCRCDCHTQGFKLYNMPDSIIEPIRHDRFPARTVFAHLGADWLAITGPQDGSGDGRAGLRLEVTPDEIAWRTQHGLTISIPPELFQVWHQALIDARRPGPPPCKTCRGKPPRGFTCSTCGAKTDTGTVRP